MGMTLTQKILAHHAGLDQVKAGQLINAKLDIVLGNDITTPVAINEFNKNGFNRVFDKDKIALVPDHFVPNKDIKSAEHCKCVREFAYRNQITNYFEVGEMGIEHALLPEKGLVVAGDVVIGATALAAEYNGVEKASAVKDKLIEMTHLNETLYCCGIACSSQGFKTKAGNYQIDLLLANVCKQNVTRFPYEIVRLAEDIAGGLMVTAPSEADFRDETLGPVIDKYLKGVDGVSTENRLRILRLIENLALGTAAVGYRTESLHGAGSPQAQRIMIARQGNLEHKKALAKALAHVKE